MCCRPVRALLHCTDLSSACAAIGPLRRNSLSLVSDLRAERV